MGKIKLGNVTNLLYICYKKSKKVIFRYKEIAIKPSNLKQFINT
jgi:hypothetical protein